jgi:hypothetical protein
MKETIQEKKLKEAITWMLREIENCPNDSMQDIANEALKMWETNLRVNSSYIVEEVQP